MMTYSFPSTLSDPRSVAWSFKVNVKQTVIILTELIIDRDAEDRASNFIKNPGNSNSAIP